jgi:hypothetical protein
MLDCSHSACVACVSAYLEKILGQWLFVYRPDCGFTMRCIMVDCECYVSDSHHYYIMGVDKYREFQQKAAEKFLVIQEGYRFCPNCNAGFIVDVEDEESTQICPECNRLFCLKCNHRGACICNEVKAL